jgi:hypothetical protein
LGDPAPARTPRAPAEAFFERLQALCGQAYEGRIVANEPATPVPDAFEGKRLVMHVRECGSDTLRVPFHVGDDRSRTWVVSRTATGLRLKHDHRHADGTPDDVSMYGGDSAGPGSAVRQEFPVDAESVALFRRAGLAASVDNVWALEFAPGDASLTYELARPQRLFRVEFDLGQPVPPPPAPWGARP